MCKLQAANHKTQSLQQPAKAAADQHHAHTQHSHTTQVISNILKACVELMAGSDCAMQAKAHMGAQCPTQSWHQGPRGLQPSQGLPLTQDSQQIPPGQVGPSQNCVGLSQQSGFIPQNRGYHPGYGTPVAPRPHVHGISFPPTPPTWTSNQLLPS